MGDFDESAHPRDTAGKFSSGGGGPESKGSGLKTWAASKIPHQGDSTSMAGRVVPLKASEPKGTKQGVTTRGWTDKPPAGMEKETWQTHYDGHPDQGGKASPARETAVHIPLMKAALDHVPSVVPGKQKIAIMTMGAPASGKSSGLRGLDMTKFAHIDPDDIKGKLPEYKAATANSHATYRGAAAMAHEESSHLAKKIQAEAIKRNQNVIIDGTGTNQKSFMGKMQSLKDAGYQVHVVMSHLNEKEGTKRALIRSEQVGRYVPKEVIKEGYEKVPKNFAAISKKADAFKVFDTSKKGGALVWEKHPSGAETHHDREFVDNFKKEHGS